MAAPLEKVCKKVVNFLNKQKYDYLIIGGIASGTLGQPRVTADVDIDIILDDEQIDDFLNKIEKDGFQLSKKDCLERIAQTGTFQIHYGEVHIDFIIASTFLEKNAFERKQKINLFNVDAFFPTPEDLILFKIIPARTQDLFDVEKIIQRNKGKLDINYLEQWARKLSDEAQDMRVWNQLKKILDSEQSNNE